MSEFLGSRISLISKSDIRYVGTLHEINSDESTVSLENVRSFGTEGRKGRPDEEIAPSDQVYEYIVFRGSDVKDLRIEDHPNIKENKPPAVPDDPAIVGARARPGAQGPNQNAPPGGPAAFGPGQGPYPPNNFYGGPPPGNWGRGGAPGPGPGPNFGNMPYPPPPGWFPPGQGFPGGPGGPNGPGVAANQRAASGSGPSQDAKPAPIGPGADRAKPATPSGQAAPPTEPKSLAQGVRQSSHAPTPPVESKPSVEEVKQTAANLAANGQAKPEDISKATPTGPRNHRVNPVIPLTGSAAKPFSLPGAGGDAASKAPAATAPPNVQDATNAARAAVAVAMAQLGNNSGNAMDNLTNKVNEMRVNAVRGGPASRGRGRGGRPPAAKVAVPDSDFDFAQSNAKFNKQDVVKEAIAGSPSEAPENPAVAEQPEISTTTDDAAVAYNKSRSFFDNISSESRERTENGGQKPGGREWRGEEQRKNMETFGQGSVDGAYRNYRGRGRGRGRGGRGYGGRYATTSNMTTNRHRFHNCSYHVSQISYFWDDCISAALHKRNTVPYRSWGFERV
ncbi:SCD6-suppressor of clathrin deficiency [Fusarium fujikuroi]|nr:SCD6-suppressor of clathrin deficiency [Fusarium fujikuroi]